VTLGEWRGQLPVMFPQPQHPAPGTTSSSPAYGPPLLASSARPAGSSSPAATEVVASEEYWKIPPRSAQTQARSSVDPLY